MVPALKNTTATRPRAKRMMAAKGYKQAPGQQNSELLYPGLGLACMNRQTEARGKEKLRAIFL